jgi:hypothetical protein
VTYEVLFDDQGVTVDLQTGTAVGDGRDVLDAIEDLVGSQYADALLGDSNANRFFGGEGDDALSGFGGDDYLDGGAGTNTNDGGEETDTCVNPDTAGGAVNCEE